MIDISEKNGAVTVKVKVQPRASKSAIVGPHGDALKIRIASPPVDGKANEECRRFFAKLLDVPINAVEIVSGSTSRDKLIRIRDAELQRVLELIGQSIAAE